MLSKVHNDVCHFYTVTEWMDLTSIKKIRR